VSASPAPSLPPVHDVGPLPGPVTVVGDVHVAPEEPRALARFLDFLGRVGGQGGTLVLLGDVFDWWVGPQQQDTPFARTILEPLRRLAAGGVRLAFQDGNRDFPFRGARGLAIDLWPDVVRTRWGGRTVVFHHGDLLCTADHDYLRMRALIRSWPARAALRAMPYAAAAYLARGLRGLSERTKSQNRGARLGLDYGYCRRWLEGYGADVLVLGHVHTGVHHRDPATGGEVLVLKDWHGTPGIVRLDEGGIRLLAP
jgi:UDP-2,3-diacylglucosamine hydrolase